MNIFYEKHRQKIIITFLLILGLVIRIQFFDFSTPIPTWDGGLFLTMTTDLINNQFQIPKFTSYNHQHIPFAYPALSFYFIGFINYLTHIDLLLLLKHLPLIYNLVAIPFFYYLSKEITNDEGKAIISSILFTISKPSYEWFIMGGGITRSPAYTFAIITIFLFVRGINKNKISSIILSGVFLGLSAMHHLEKAQFTIIALTLITLLYKRSFRNIKFYLVAGFVSLLCFLPLFVPVYKFHGLDPYISALSSGEFSFPLSIIKLVFFNFFSISPFLDIVSVITLIGFTIKLFEKTSYSKFLPIWLIIICFLNPRSVDKFAIIPGSILFSYGLTILSNGLDTYIKSRNYQIFIEKKEYRKLSILFSLILILSILFSSKVNTLTKFSISEEDIKAMNWIKENTPETASFIVIPSSFWAGDLVGEWFPAFTNRTNVLCVQGTEWNGNYKLMRETHENFNLSLKNSGVENTINNLINQSEYIYCSEHQYLPTINYCPQNIKNYSTIYKDSEKNIFIYQKQ